MKSSKTNLVDAVKNVDTTRRFHSIEEERRVEPVEALMVIVRRPEPAEGFFAPTEYRNKP